MQSIGVDHVFKNTSRENPNDTGKWGAVRNNSGEWVDHSHPGLRVGPTTPSTSDRTSGACPPDSLDISQRKSGRESEGGALSGASEASDVLRSAATQQGSSLELNQINRYASAPNELRKRGRKNYCGMRSLRGRAGDASHEKVIRLDCNTWDCAYCGPRKASRYRQAICAIAEREELTRFLTLTLDPSKIEGEAVRFLRGVFNKFRVSLFRKYGRHSINYIAVLEFHKSGVPHLHVVLSKYIPQKWISLAWSSLGGGSIVHIKQVDVHRISYYLAKYLTKELLMSAPARSRRITTSRSIQLTKRKQSETVWVLDERSIFHLFAIFGPSAQEVEIDKEGFLFSFAVLAGSFAPPWLNHSPK
jgi:hypothetical protein